MKSQRSVIMLFMIVLVSLSTPAFADHSSASRQTLLNNLTDSIATFGKDPADKKEIIHERRRLRRDARLQKEERRKKELTKARMKVQQNLIMEKVRVHQN